MIYYQVVETWAEMTNEKLKYGLGEIRKVIVNGLGSSFEKPDVFEKYKWLKDQYNNLIISNDYDYETKTEGQIKLKLRELNEDLGGHNIHYKYTDDFYATIK